MRYSFVFVNYNSEILINRSIKSILKYISTSFDFEFIVVDHSGEYFNRYSVDNLYYFSRENEGFGSGMNYGSSASNGEVLIIVNPDIYIVNKFCIDSYKVNSNTIAGFLVRPLSYNFDGLLPSPLGLLKEFVRCIFLFLLPNIYNKIALRIKHTQLSLGLKGCAPVEATPGCFVMFSREAFFKLGGYDVGFFLYFEDTDLFARAHDEKYEVLCYDGDFIVHETKPDSVKISGLVLRYYLTSLFRYSYKRLHVYFKF